MIRRIYSDLPGFKNLDFKPGLNILLAEKSAGATEKQTRNGAGKSSLVEVMHFLLGAKCDKSSLFKTDALAESVFGMEFELGGSFTRVERTGAKPTPLTVAGHITDWPIAPTPQDGSHAISNDNWKLVLAKLMFGLDEPQGPGGPSFRSLISYFARRDRDGGMDQPTMIFRRQSLADQQINVSFLLGLDWALPREWQTVRERESSLEQIRKSMKDGTFGSVVGTASHLKSELIVAQDRVKRLKTAVSSFKVVDEYHELEKEASRITAQLAELSDENVLDKRYIDELENTTVQEVAPAPADLENLFREAGVVLPGLVRKRFDEAERFHSSVVKNRRAYLQSEIGAAARRIDTRSAEMKALDIRRAELMAVLQSSGALESFASLQTELTKAETTVETLRHRHETAESLESGDLKLKVERARLLEQLRREYAEQDTIMQEAVLTFRNISSQLYEDDKAGTLTITPTENGPVFDPHIPGEKSKGVNNMRIFCFDAMLMLLSLRRGRSPGFLVHDSHLFDGVDERQVGQALALGARLAAENNFQYIVTMNTDSVPRELPAGFRPSEYALPVRLTDASENGGLFGFRFE